MEGRSGIWLLQSAGSLATIRIDLKVFFLNSHPTDRQQDSCWQGGLIEPRIPVYHLESAEELAWFPARNRFANKILGVRAGLTEWKFVAVVETGNANQ